MTISQTQLNPLNPTSKFGVEVELEQVRALTGSTYWATERDGSLVDGREFVFQRGTLGMHVPEALAELHAHLNRQTGVDPSIRCSTHVHIEVSRMDEEHRQTFLMMCMLFEEVLYRLGGAERRANPYCMSIMGSGEYIRRFLAGDDRDVARGWEKYTSINLSRYNDLGTFEFRTMEGTTDMNRVLSYVTVISRIKDLACSMTKGEFAKAYRFNPFSLFEQVFDLQDEYIASRIGDYNTAVAKGVALCDITLRHMTDTRRKEEYIRVDTVRTINHGELEVMYGIKGVSLPVNTARKLFGALASRFIHPEDLHKVI